MTYYVWTTIHCILQHMQFKSIKIVNQKQKKEEKKIDTYEYYRAKNGHVN